MAANDTVKAYQIDVDTQNGVVTLTGDVDTTAAKTQAVRIARETDGVRDVIDQIQVTETAATGGLLEPGDDRAGRDAGDRLEQGARDLGDRAGDSANRAGAALSDAAITSAVKAKLLADSGTRGTSIDVDTRAGVVALNGTVASRAEAERAVTLARNTDGVDHVVNNLKVGR